GSRNSYYVFALASGGTGAYLSVYVQPCADNGGVADAPAHFKAHAAGGTTTRQPSFTVKRNHPDGIMVPFAIDLVGGKGAMPLVLNILTVDLRLVFRIF